MNNVSLVGRLARDVDVRYTNGENAQAIGRFTVAVQRRFKNREGNYDADFITCTAFGKTAEFIQKYFHKGSMIGVTGEIRTGSYTNKDGVKVYTTEVSVSNAEFVGGSNNNNGGGTQETNFVDIPDGVDEELPFR